MKYKVKEIQKQANRQKKKTVDEKTDRQTKRQTDEKTGTKKQTRKRKIETTKEKIAELTSAPKTYCLKRRKRLIRKYKDSHVYLKKKYVQKNSYMCYPYLTCQSLPLLLKIIVELILRRMNILQSFIIIRIDTCDVRTMDSITTEGNMKTLRCSTFLNTHI